MRKMPLCQIVLWNDNEHSYDYVIDMLVENLSFSEEKAIEHAMDVDSNGRTVLMVCEKEQAERERDRILRRSQNPMRATVEPV